MDLQQAKLEHPSVLEEVHPFLDSACIDPSDCFFNGLLDAQFASQDNLQFPTFTDESLPDESGSNGGQSDPQFDADPFQLGTSLDDSSFYDDTLNTNNEDYLSLLDTTPLSQDAEVCLLFSPTEHSHSSSSSSPPITIPAAGEDITCPQNMEMYVSLSSPTTVSQGPESQSSRMRKAKKPQTSKREERKKEKPEKCSICGKGHDFKRDLTRHYKTNHPKTAEGMGIDMSRFHCKYCGISKSFSRRDHLTRHLNRKHGR